jgi:hypothetical protein
MWQFIVYRTDSEEPLHPCCYIDDESTGSAKRIGYISSYEGINQYDKTRTEIARRTLDGVQNVDSTPRFVADICKLPTNDIFLE